MVIWRLESISQLANTGIAFARSGKGGGLHIVDELVQLSSQVVIQGLKSFVRLVCLV